MKYTDEQFHQSAKDKYPNFFNEYEILDKYQGNKTKLKIKHLKCNTVFEKDPMHLLRGQFCNKCSSVSHWDKDRYINAVKQLTDGDYEVLGNFINTKTKILMHHNSQSCNADFYIRPEDFIRGQRCSVCAKKRGGISNRTPANKFNEKFKSIANNEYELLSEYNTLHNKIKIKHLKCGYIYDVLPNNFLKGNRCPKCYGHIPLLEIDVKKEIEKDINYEYISGFKSMKSKIEIKHKVCNNVYTTTLGIFRQGCRCPNCAFKSRSKKEKELSDYIQSLGFNVIENKRYYDSINKKKFIEIDILLENPHTAFEFDGIFWHSQLKGKTADFHLKKTAFMEKNGYKLIHIFEDEWDYNKDKVKEKIKKILNNELIIPDNINGLVDLRWDNLYNNYYTQNNYTLKKIIEPQIHYYSWDNKEYKTKEEIPGNLKLEIWDCGWAQYEKN